MGPAGGRRRQRLRALLRRAARQEGAHRQAQDPAQGRRRALPRHRRGPRGRGDRLAPARRAEAEGHPGAPDGLPRDHQGRRSSRRSRTRARSTTTSSRPRRRAASSTASTATRSARCSGRRSCPASPPGRVQSVATRLVVDQRARADEVPRRVLLGPRGHLRRRRREGAADVPGQAPLDRRHPGRERLRLRRRRSAQGQEGRPGPPRPRRGRGARRGARRHDVRGPLGRGQALPPPALRAVPHHHPAAGGQPQARHVRVGDDVGRPAALRERLHHLHAHRLDDAVGRARSTRPGRRSASSTAPSTSPTSRASTPARSRTPRRRTRRSARPASRSAPRRRPG